jgi:multicomponent Na+:H+ antiporter subunit A
VRLAPGYHLDAGGENLMALAAWALGALALVAARARRRVVRAFARAGDLLGPRRLYAAALGGINRFSDRIHAAEVRDLRTSLAAVLIPTGVLVAIGFAVTPTEDAYTVGGVGAEDLPIVVLLGLAVVAALRLAADQGRVRPVLALSVVGFALAGVYAVVGAPDVTLVAVVVETVLTLVFVGVLSRLPFAEDATRPPRRPPVRRWRNVAAGVIAGAAAFAAIWAALSRPTVEDTAAGELVRQTPEAHGGDVVTVILADFRGLDTMVEITVLLVALFGVASLLRRGRSW